MFALNCLCASTRRPDAEQNEDALRRALTLTTLATILFGSLALDHERPTFSMPPAYKEERTDAALSRACLNIVVFRKARCITTGGDSAHDD